jgi:hypothetical protein
METISKITPLQEKIIWLSSIMGLRYKEIAVKINYSVTNCQNQVFYAKKKTGATTKKELLKIISMNYKNWTEEQVKEYTQRWQVSTGSDLMKIYGVSQRTITAINQHFGLKLKTATDAQGNPIKKSYRKRKAAYPFGTIVYHNVNGKKRAFIITDQGRVRLHIHTWKQAGRDIPKGYVLGFKDLNQENNQLENLVLKTREEIARDNVRKAYPNPQAKIRRFNGIKRAGKGNVRPERSKAKEAKENRLKVEREWQAQSKKNKIVKKYPNKAVDLSSKVAVRLNAKTIVFVNPGADIEEIKKRYSKAS